jgi:hypothetical protein
MPVLRRAEETPAASKKELLLSRGPPDIMIAIQPAETFVHSANGPKSGFDPFETLSRLAFLGSFVNIVRMTVVVITLANLWWRST